MTVPEPTVRATRKAYQGAVDMVGEMPESVEYSPHPDFYPELTAVDYRRMGAKWERWAKKLARRATDLLTELDGRDEEARERWIAKILDETSIKAMEFRAGVSMELEPAREMVAHWVGAARGMLGEAENYSETPIEMVVKVAESPETFAFILQRVGKLTPHQARLRAEAERDEARAEIERLAALLREHDDCRVCGHERRQHGRDPVIRRDWCSGCSTRDDLHEFQETNDAQ